METEIWSQLDEMHMNTLIVPEAVLKAAAALQLELLLFDLSGTKEALGEVYRLTEEVRPLYLKHRNTDRLQCFLQKQKGRRAVI